MIIKGNTVGSTTPRTNYNQTDPRKSDYLVGKDALDQNIENARKAAENAGIAAGKAVMKSGSKMEGDIDMNGHHIINLPTPTKDTDVITKYHMEKYINETFLGGEW